MATTTLDTVSELLQEAFEPLMAKTLKEDQASVARLISLGKLKVKEQEKIIWNAVKTPYAGVNNIVDGETLPTADDEEYMQATLEYKLFYAGLKIGRQAQMISKRSGEYISPRGKADLLADQMEAAIEQIGETLHDQIVGVDAAAKELVGFGDAVGKTTNTWANIDRTTYTRWRPYVSENGGVNRTLTIAMLRTMEYNLKNTRSAKISEVWCGTTAFNAIADAINLASPQRQQDPTKAIGGTVEINWRGIPFLMMPDMDTNASWWLDMTSIELLRQHSEEFLINQEYTRSYAEEWSVSCAYLLKIGNPWRQGALLDIS